MNDLGLRNHVGANADIPQRWVYIDAFEPLHTPCSYIRNPNPRQIWLAWMANDVVEFFYCL